MSRFSGVEDRIVEVAIGQVKGFFTPSDAERAAAYELLVELTTRPVSARLTVADVSLADELASVDEMFGLTRQILRQHGVDGAKGSAGNLSLAVVALRVLNEVFAPVVNRWRPLLAEHAARRPPGEAAPTELEWERRWERAQQCRTDLDGMRSSVRAYVETLSRIAGASAIADAVLGAPTSMALPRTIVESSLRPAGLDPAIRPRRRMVQWLDLIEMIPAARSYRPGHRSVEQAEHRAMVVERDAAGRPLPTATFTAAAGDDFWFDYVADMGDGFDGTAPVAWLLGRRSIQLSDRGAADLPTPPASMPRGELLVFGGDQIYPFARPGGYEAQTELPYRMGLEGEPGDGDPTLVAIPGNHDWLGGVEQFEQMFVSQRRFADHWRTVQQNNWFHVQLPQGWWLWGIDTGLHDELVGPQEEYFRGAAELLRPGDRVVLCTPVPLWQLRQKFPKPYAKLRSTIDPLIAGANASMPLCLSGDTHAFAHLERVDVDQPEDHVMAGGGGAFMQPTHNLPERVPLERGNAEFKLTARWPLPADSRSIAPGGAKVLGRQYWAVAVLLALVFAGLTMLAGLRVCSGSGAEASCTGWTAIANVTVEAPDAGSDEAAAGDADVDGDDADRIVATSVDQLDWLAALRWTLASPWVLILVALLAEAGTVAFRANSRESSVTKATRVYGLVGGLGVATTMVLAATSWLAVDLGGILRWPAFVALSALAGFASLAVFLAVATWSNRRIRANDTLAVVPAGSTRYKHFLRFRIDQDGDLTCYAIGIDPVGAGWYEAMTPPPGQRSAVPPYDPAGTPRLHYVWGKTYRKFTPQPLKVALSASDPGGNDQWSTGDGTSPLAAAVEAISARLVDGGHTLMYGGRPAEGLTDRLHRLDVERHADNPNAMSHLVSYVADHFWNDELATDHVVRQIRVRPGLVDRTDPAGDEHAPGHAVLQTIANLSAMRRLMTDHADARVVVGGDLRPGAPGTRIAPGVLEEAYLAIEAGVPLVVVGGFGGVGELIARALVGQLDQVEIDELSQHFVEPSTGPGFVEMLRRCSSIGVLRNDLSNGENLELFRSRDPYTVTSLVLRSLYRLGANR